MSQPMPAPLSQQRPLVGCGNFKTVEDTALSYEIYSESGSAALCDFIDIGQLRAAFRTFQIQQKKAVLCFFLPLFQLLDEAWRQEQLRLASLSDADFDAAHQQDKNQWHEREWEQEIRVRLRQKEFATAEQHYKNVRRTFCDAFVWNASGPCLGMDSKKAMMRMFGEEVPNRSFLMQALVKIVGVLSGQHNPDSTEPTSPSASDSSPVTEADARAAAEHPETTPTPEESDGTSTRLPRPVGQVWPFVPVLTISRSQATAKAETGTAGAVDMPGSAKAEESAEMGVDVGEGAAVAEAVAEAAAEAAAETATGATAGATTEATAEEEEEAAEAAAEEATEAAAEVATAAASTATGEGETVAETTSTPAQAAEEEGHHVTVQLSGSECDSSKSDCSSSRLDDVSTCDSEGEDLQSGEEPQSSDENRSERQLLVKNTFIDLSVPLHDLGAVDLRRVRTH